MQCCHIALFLNNAANKELSIIHYLCVKANVKLHLDIRTVHEEFTENSDEKTEKGK